MNKIQNLSATEANSKPIMLDLDTLEKMFQDRFKDQGIQLIEVINDRIKEMVKMGVGKKHNEIHKQLAYEITMTCQPIQNRQHCSLVQKCCCKTEKLVSSNCEEQS